MTSVSRWIALGLILSAALLSACATSLPTAEENSPIPETAEVPARAPEPEQEINRVAVRDFSNAIDAMQRGRYHDAERVLLKLTQEYPQLSGPYANLGIVYLHFGKMPQAVDALKQAIAINSRHAEYYNQLGIVYRQNGQLDLAQQAYEKALQLDPNYAYAHLNVGILYDLYLRDLAKALLHYERYQALLPNTDAQVNKWIVDLKQRSKTAGKNGKGSDG
ncbi:MAG: tetratricopeptide repeat protein [Gammaproteobacteria bacterium]|nr:tetratricopeptide repeat protein [Gammaproteobacteria bacterium]